MEIWAKGGLSAFLFLFLLLLLLLLRSFPLSSGLSSKADEKWKEGRKERRV